METWNHTVHILSSCLVPEKISTRLFFIPDCEPCVNTLREI